MKAAGGNTEICHILGLDGGNPQLKKIDCIFNIYLDIFSDEINIYNPKNQSQVSPCQLAVASIYCE